MRQALPSAARLTRPFSGENSARRASFPGQFAVSATACWLPRGFGWNRLAFPGTLAGTACQLSRAVCRLGDRLLASQGVMSAPAGALRSHRLPVDRGSCLPLGIQIQQSHPIGMLRSYHL